MGNSLRSQDMEEDCYALSKKVQEVRERKKCLFAHFHPVDLSEDLLSRYYEFSLLGNFEVCPLEVIDMILSFVPFQDLTKMAQLNWWWNIRADHDALWRQLYHSLYSNSIPASVQNWKIQFRDTYLWGERWNADNKSRQLKVSPDGRQIYIEKGYEWSTCQIGKKSIDHYIKKRWTFRVLSTVGLMIGLAEKSWEFVDSYPGTGYYGCTKKLPVHNPESKRANQKVFSIACYEVFDRFDKLEMRVNSVKKRVKFYRNDKLMGCVEIDDNVLPMVPVCALCGPSSALEIIQTVTVPHQSASNAANRVSEKGKENGGGNSLLPALTQSHPMIYLGPVTSE